MQENMFKIDCSSLLDSVGEGEGGMIWENGIEICIISYMKRVAICYDFMSKIETLW